jgi:hypothetical protein
MDDHGSPRSQELRAVSDKMLDMLQRMKVVEQAKREMDLGSDEFVRLAKEVDELARVVKLWAQHQMDLARQLSVARQEGTVEAVRLTDVKSRPLDRILVDWREAEMRLSGTQAGSPEAQRASADIERMREEYGTAQREKRRD